MIGYNGNLDCSLFYGNEKQWMAYALGGNTASDSESDKPSHVSDISVLENDEYKITIERK